jgi:hypothetical protein
MDLEFVKITIDDAVAPLIGAMIVFRPASGSDLKTVVLCAADGAVLGPYEIPGNTNRIVVFLGAVVDANRQPLCAPGSAGQPTTGTVTAQYLPPAEA